jgi:hypothetical protein
MALERGKAKEPDCPGEILLCVSRSVVRYSPIVKSIPIPWNMALRKQEFWHIKKRMKRKITLIPY